MVLGDLAVGDIFRLVDHDDRVSDAVFFVVAGTTSFGWRPPGSTLYRNASTGKVSAGPASVKVDVHRNT